jgi:peptidoglycan/LPS O-acetylase OafA/YrhL
MNKKISRHNNFDFLRFVLASFVIITHSYPLTGNKEHDILYKLTDGQTLLSYIAVRGFFSISGYLIFQSLMRSSSIKDYLWKRALRIFPALLAALCLSVILGYFAYSGFSSYWLNTSTWSYIPKNLFFYFSNQSTIDGVFVDNRYRPAINGSLWTIPYEFTCYLLLIPFYFLKTKPKILFTCLVTGTFIFFIMAAFFPNRGGHYDFVAWILNLGHNLLQHLFFFFLAGSFLAYIQISKLKSKNIVLIAIFILLIISFKTNTFIYANYLLIPMLTVLFGISSWYGINKIGESMGDVSYGLYIYAFPIQQMIEFYFKPTPSIMMGISFPLIFITALLSWHFLEKPILKFKNVIRKSKYSFSP